MEFYAVRIVNANEEVFYECLYENQAEAIEAYYKEITSKDNAHNWTIKLRHCDLTTHKGKTLLSYLCKED